MRAGAHRSQWPEHSSTLAFVAVDWVSRRLYLRAPPSREARCQVINAQYPLGDDQHEAQVHARGDEHRSWNRPCRYRGQYRLTDAEAPRNWHRDEADSPTPAPTCYDEQWDGPEAAEQHEVGTSRGPERPTACAVSPTS